MIEEEMAKNFPKSTKRSQGTDSRSPNAHQKGSINTHPHTKAQEVEKTQT